MGQHVITEGQTCQNLTSKFIVTPPITHTLI